MSKTIILDVHKKQPIDLSISRASGTADYNKLFNKPSINGVTVVKDQDGGYYSLQDKLVAGDGINISDNGDHTATISTEWSTDDAFFTVTKDVTPYAELRAAVDAGKLIFLQLSPASVPVLSNVVRVANDGTINIRCLQLNQLVLHSVDRRNTWTSSVLANYTDYNESTNKPSINGVELAGNRSIEALGVNTLTNVQIQQIFNRVFGG